MADDGLIELEVLGVRQHPEDDALIVLLLEPVGELVVPIVVGPGEASAIASAQAGIVPPRPMTHDLLRGLLDAGGVIVEHVEITELTDGVFHAAVVLGGDRRVDSRASDAIAVAVRVGCPVLCAVDVLEAAGIGAVIRPAEDEVAEFREFLDQVSPEDFDDHDGPGPEVGDGPEGAGGRS